MNFAKPAVNFFGICGWRCGLLAWDRLGAEDTIPSHWQQKMRIPARKE